MIAPLEGMRVLELATGVAGPYGGRLLAMLGATVVKVEPRGGDPTRWQPADSRETPAPSDLFVHLNTGKRLVSAGVVALDAALDWADLVIASGVRRDLLAQGVDPPRLAARIGAPLLVTTAACGFDGEEGGEPVDELLVQARSGLMSTTGDPPGPAAPSRRLGGTAAPSHRLGGTAAPSPRLGEGSPLRFPGYVSQAMAGAYVAAAALAGLRRPGTGHVHVPWLLAIASGVEAGWARQLQTGRREGPAGAHPAELYPSGALPCRDGFVVPGTIRPLDWVAQCRAYAREDLLDDERFRSRERRARHVDALWHEIAPWYAGRERREIFERALAFGWALGMVLRASDGLDDPHLVAREFLGEVELPSGGRARLPRRPWIAPGLPAGESRLATPGEHDGWFARAVREPRERTARPRLPLGRVRILELTQAWAGPFVGRLLGALGADVVKVEGASRPDGWRAIVSFKQMAPHLARDPDELSLEINANFNSINRNKRHVSIDLTRPEGRALFLELVRVADAVVVNMTARVLPALRLDYGVLRAANPAIILVNMPALGASGPYRDAAGYGSIVEGMGGFGALFGPPRDGARISQTFFPDPVAGIHASVALLSMLERRERTGEGGEVDLSQQESLLLLLGESIVAASRGGDLERVGNAMPGAGLSGVVRARDGWVALVAPAACREWVERAAELDAATLIERLQASGGRASRVLHYAEARASAEMRDALETLWHPVTERLPYLRVPLVWDGAPIDSRRPAPTFDQHTREVLAEWLGLGEREIERTLASEAVGGAPDPARLRGFYLERARLAGAPAPSRGLGRATRA